MQTRWLTLWQTIRDIFGVICERPPKNFPRQFLPKTLGFGDSLHNFFERIGVGAKVKSYFAKQKRNCGCERRRRFWNRVCPYRPKRGDVFLTIGMAHFQDWEGAWATIQSIWSEAVAAGVADLIEVLVVDQSSESPHGEKLRGYLQGWGLRSKYVSQPNVGTAMGKHAVFANATGEWVMLLDCHADLQPGSLGNVVKWIMRNRFNQSLFGGVMEFGGGYQWYRERIGAATLADPKRRDVAMFAPQTVALIEDCAKRPTAAEKLDCVLGTDRGYHSHVDREWRGDSLGRWATDPRAADPKSQPFTVDNLAGWFLFSRRDSWLRLMPYHPLMKGFGGEEGVMTLAFERAKFGSFVHPAARATHRFGRAEPPKFSNNLHDRIKNYALAFTQWDRPDELERMRTYFTAERESVLMPEAEFDVLAATAIAEHHSFIEQQKAARTPTFTLEEQYQQVLATPSDINEHLPTLRRLASECEHVTAFAHQGPSSVALLAAQPKSLVLVDRNCKECSLGNLRSVAGQTSLTLIAADTREHDLAETDLLFIDTIHTAEHVAAELRFAADRVRKYIALHDTETFGKTGEGGAAGIMMAVQSFLADYYQWSIAERYDNNNGLLVLAVDADSSAEVKS